MFTHLTSCSKKQILKIKNTQRITPNNESNIPTSSTPSHFFRLLLLRVNTGLRRSISSGAQSFFLDFPFFDGS